MRQYPGQRSQRAIQPAFKVLSVTVILLAFAAGTLFIVWSSLRRSPASEISSAQRAGGARAVLALDYTVTAQPGYIRVNGTTNLPNGVVLVGSLDKIGAGLLDVKEAFVMDRGFSMEFGPRLHAQYHLVGDVEALTAGPYRVRVEFNPAQQSPFTRELLAQGPQTSLSSPKGDGRREFDPATVHVARVLLLGTPEEQEAAQAVEQEYRQQIRQQFTGVLGLLSGLWQRLRLEYQQERSRGPFSRGDARATAWRTWATQWAQELGSVADTYGLAANVSPVSPYPSVRNTLLFIHKHLATLGEWYFDVLANERPENDRDLPGVEREVELGLSDANAQLGQPTSSPPLPKAEGKKPTIVVTAPLANIRSGPGMAHDVVVRAKKDDEFRFLAEKGEWFQVQLSDGRSGWLHQNVGSRKSAGGIPLETRRAETKTTSAERKANLQLQPVPLQSTPLAFIPRPTPDEMRVYAEIEQQLREVPYRDPDERRLGEYRARQRVSERYSISPDLAWNVYLKVQGWEVHQQ
jgi:hypothetical protein